MMFNRYIHELKLLPDEWHDLRALLSNTNDVHVFDLCNPVERHPFISKRFTQAVKDEVARKRTLQVGAEVLAPSHKPETSGFQVDLAFIAAPPVPIGAFCGL